ncbi:MAG TPA: hypothetical protein IAC66_06335 [Candidatus Aphodousia gallistercoris]|nr:hypothetical protein [Candidatus Aphodousia gallistercoris]
MAAIEYKPAPEGRLFGISRANRREVQALACTIRRYFEALENAFTRPLQAVIFSPTRAQAMAIVDAVLAGRAAYYLTGNEPYGALNESVYLVDGFSSAVGMMSNPVKAGDRSKRLFLWIVRGKDDLPYDLAPEMGVTASDFNALEKKQILKTRVQTPSLVNKLLLLPVPACAIDEYYRLFFGSWEQATDEKVASLVEILGNYTSASTCSLCGRDDLEDDEWDVDDGDENEDWLNDGEGL